MGLFSKKPKAPAPPAAMTTREPSHHWSLFEEGQLLIDMYETDDTVVIRSFVAGVAPEDLDISIHNDMLTVRGSRRDQEEIHDDRFYHRECHWGTFSRSIIIPLPVDLERIRALFKDGVVTIILPILKGLDASLPNENAEKI